MSEVTEKKHQKNEGNHDNCADCVRQKKENQAFIKIYERLQDVQKKTCRMRQAVSQHRNASDTNRSFYKFYEQKLLSNHKKVQKDGIVQSIQAAGFEIAARIVEKQAKNKIVAENNRLKQALSRMQRQKNVLQNCQEPYNQIRQIRESRMSLGKNEEAARLNMTSDSNLAQSLYSPRWNQQKLSSSQDTDCSLQQNSSTKSTSFNLTRIRNSMDLSKYNDLNLWLYQNENAKLQEQLYLVKQVKNRSFLAKKKNALLPSIRK